VVIAFLGSPHRIDNRGKAQLSKALAEIGFEAYYAAEQCGWVLFLEGATDLAILRALAGRLGHEAHEALDRPFVDYVQNQPQRARSHFYGLREAVPGLVGFALFDRLEQIPEEAPPLSFHCWQRREIENYICQPETLITWARATGGARSMGGLFEISEADRWETTMRENISRLVPPIALDDPTDVFWVDTKASDAFLDRLFERFFADLGLENLLRKTNYHVLADHIAVEAIDGEVREVLDRIRETQGSSHPSDLPGTS
jgi:hypothetical protein